MDPAQLLNPKAFAKQQKSKKRMPNYGPKQIRKGKTDNDTDNKVTLPTYDPRTLLNPKAGVKQPKMDDKHTSFDENASMNGNSQSLNGSQTLSNPQNLYEKLHNVENRDSIRTTKRKADTSADAEDEEATKKQKSTFGDIGRGSILSESLKKEREKLATANGPETSIDLTAENDNDNDVVIVGDSDGSEEVCLGRLSVKANCTLVPFVNIATVAKFDKDWWPPTRVKISRQTDVNTIIDVVDSSNKVFGRIDPTVAVTLVPMMDGANISKLRVKAFLGKRKKLPKEKIGDEISRALDLELTLYAPRNRAMILGRFLSRKQLWLSNPPVIEHGKELFNPHDLRKNHTPRNLPAVFSSTSRGSAAAPIVSVVTRTVEEMRREASSLFDQIIREDGLGEMDNPVLITTPLLKHQRQALRFLLEHEVHDFANDDQSATAEQKQSSHLWKSHIKKDGSRAWYNIITGHEIDTQPEPTRGGILGDVMGLGKTLSIMSLIAATQDQARAFRKAQLPTSVATMIERNSRATLVICPKSVLTNWEDQLKAHTELTYLVYHGSTRTQDLHELATKDIILTTYGVLTNEATASGQQKNRALMKINWFRVVLDEAHHIRNAATGTHKAACKLEAERRWAVTGTPIQNRIEDMGSLVKFIKVKPFDEPEAWSRYLTSRFKTGNAEALNHLKILIQSLTLRRVKDSIDLVKKTESIVSLKFTAKERSIYTAFALQSRKKIDSLYRNGGKARLHSQVLKHMLRMRLICAHGQEMLSADDLAEIAGMDESNAIDLGDETLESEESFTTEKSAYEHLSLLYKANSDTCAECERPFIKRPEDEEATDDVQDLDEDDGVEITSDSGEDDEQPQEILGVLTPCFHLLHTKCKAAHQDGADQSRLTDGFHTCQYCKSHVRDEYFELTQSGLDKYHEDQERKRRMHKTAMFDPATYVPHTKVLRLIEDLQKSARETEKLPEGEPPIRSIVFSEWTSYLDLIGYALENEGIRYVRLDGSMSLKIRGQVMQQFKTDPNITVFLVSIRAGGVGLNLTAANKVYLMEPQYNPGVEAQAVDRVHRIGQTRDVEIIRLIMHDSIEEAVLRLQEKKKKLAVMSLERKLSKDEEAKSRLQELRELFK